MHPLFIKADKLSHEVIGVGAAIDVHRHNGSGLIELMDSSFSSFPSVKKVQVSSLY